MLVCPQCQSENPQEHKFCQNCGFSLTDKDCCQCGTMIPIEAEKCHACGAANQTILWAIFSQFQNAEELVAINSGNVKQEVAKIDIENLSDFFNESSERIQAASAIKPESVNVQQRYITISKDEPQPKDLISPNTKNVFYYGKVVDKHPLHKSRLATLQQQQKDLFAELNQKSDNSYLAVTQYWNLIGIPTHALPYLILDKYAPIVPPICEAWQDDKLGVVLLPDRSQWQLFSELCLQEQLPLAQIIWFFDEIAKLWSPLSKVSCGRSLLVDTNLRVDEDWSLCLQQLYLDEIDSPPTVQDLIQSWHNCLTQLDRNDLDALYQLLETAIANKLEDVEQLRIQLQELDSGDNEYNADFTDIGKADSLDNVDVSRSDLTDNIEKESQTVSFFDEEEDDLTYSSGFEEEATAMIPMRLANVVDSSCTNIGSQRDHNEDFFGVKTLVTKTENNVEQVVNVRGMYIVCDGMGGHAAGEVASAMAVETLEKYFQEHWKQELPTRETIESGILLANNTLYQTNLNHSRSGSGRMGTTLVMALLQNNQLAIAHVGDSRIYKVTRTKGLEKLTLDHEVGQREINRGVEPEIAYGRPDAYQLTQALGPRDSNCIRPEIQFLNINEDSLILLCSDGLSDNDLLEKHWEDYLTPLISSSANLEHGLFKLIEFANQYNGHDNITCVLIRIKLKTDS